MSKLFWRKKAKKNSNKKKFKKLEKETAKIFKKKREQYENLSDEDKHILKKNEIIMVVYLALMIVMFLLNLYFGLIFALLSGLCIFLVLRKKNSDIAKLFPLLALCVSLFFSLSIATEKFQDYEKKQEEKRREEEYRRFQEDNDFIYEMLDELYKKYSSEIKE